LAGQLLSTNSSGGSSRTSFTVSIGIPPTIPPELVLSSSTCQPLLLPDSILSLLDVDNDTISLLDIPFLFSGKMMAEIKNKSDRKTHTRSLNENSRE